jgi:hypothetical protein
MKKLCILILAIGCGLILRAQPLKPGDLQLQAKKIVAFIFVRANGNLVPYGTGFFVAKRLDSLSEMAYFVTARHVLMDSGQQHNLDSIFIRYNDKSGGCVFAAFKLFFGGPLQNVFLHPDQTIDVAVIPVQLDLTKIDVLTPELDDLIGKADFVAKNVHEGSEVFFTGLFTPYLGEKRNHPIFRYGHISLLTDEKIPFVGFPRDIFLVESTCFGGNSGSPLFCYVQEGNMIHMRLAGLVSGNYTERKNLVTSASLIPKAENNIGISAITPADYIIEIVKAQLKQTNH